MLKYFYGSFVFTGFGLALAALYGYVTGHTVQAALSVLWICIVLGILEISLSFDNTIINATVMRNMDEKWQQRFVSWGIFIAVFGMRVVFPILIVSIAGHISPPDALHLAFTDPARYAQIVSNAHTGIMGFGGAFLLLVGLNFFFDLEKEYHWISLLERPLQKLATYEAVKIVVALLALFAASHLLELREAYSFLVSGIFGIAAFFAVEWLGNLLEVPEQAVAGVKQGGLAAFVYLEVLDASFSFDGVIGAFALSNNLIIIALGLGIGAMFVRSLTLAFVRSGTLSQFRYLEHGAFWAILALAVIMFLSVKYEIPETVTGTIGAVLIGLSLLASMSYNKSNPQIVASVVD